jgi:hypothetical protein
LPIYQQFAKLRHQYRPLHLSAATSVFKPLIYLTRRLACLAVLLLPLASGCALWKWNKADWTLENYRDPRAVDIDHRLDKPGNAVQNPF